MTQRAQSAMGDSGSHYFWGVQVFSYLRQTETKVETDKYIMWHLQLQLHVNMVVYQRRDVYSCHNEAWGWDQCTIDEMTTWNFSPPNSQNTPSNSGYLHHFRVGGGDECDIKFAKLTVAYIVTMTNPQYWDPWGQYRGQRPTKILAVHFKLSSNSNPSFQLLSQ